MDGECVSSVLLPKEAGAVDTVLSCGVNRTKLKRKYPMLVTFGMYRVEKWTGNVRDATVIDLSLPSYLNDTVYDIWKMLNGKIRECYVGNGLSMKFIDACDSIRTIPIESKKSEGLVYGSGSVVLQTVDGKTYYKMSKSLKGKLQPKLPLQGYNDITLWLMGEKVKMVPVVEPIVRHYTKMKNDKLLDIWNDLKGDGIESKLRALYVANIVYHNPSDTVEYVM
jgi:hypothetical protein